MKQDNWGARMGRKAASRDMGGTKPGGKPQSEAPLLKPSQTVRLATGGRVRRASGGAADDDRETIDLTGGELDRILGGVTRPIDNKKPNDRADANTKGFFSQIHKGKSLEAATDAADVLGPSFVHPDRDSGKTDKKGYRAGGRVKLADGGSPKGKSHGKSPRSKSARPQPVMPPPDVGAPPAGIGSAPPPVMPQGPGFKNAGRVTVRDGVTNRFKAGGTVDLAAKPLRLAAGGVAKEKRGVATAAGKPQGGNGKQHPEIGTKRKGPKLYGSI